GAPAAVEGDPEEGGEVRHVQGRARRGRVRARVSHRCRRPREPGAVPELRRPGLNDPRGGTPRPGAHPSPMDSPAAGPGIESLLGLLARRSREQAFIFLDPEGVVTHWSTGASEIFGYRPEEIVGRPVALLFTPEDRAEGLPEFECQVAQRDDAAEDDRWQLRKDGSRFWANGLLVALRD